MTKASFVLTPAYGRDYESSQDVLKDWLKDKDFVINSMRPVSGTYTNRRDLEQMQITQVNVRWSKNSQVGVLHFDRQTVTWTIDADD
jgi:hypothetical protein